MSPLAVGDDCPVPGCPRKRARGHLMCRTDWRRVSRPTQQRVYRTWRAYRSVETPEMLRRARAAYEEAAAAAVDEAGR